jgi:hypothetical protein
MQTLINTKPEYKSLRTYNLDCEYNKNCNDIKETPRCPKGTKPDLIIHKRGNNDNNLLIIEFKSHSSKLRKYKDFGVSKDVIKLEDFTSNYKYNYQLGVLVKLKIDGAKYSYFINGIETKVNCYE